MAATANLDTSARLDIICRKGDTFILDMDFGESVTPSGTNSFSMHVRETDTSEGNDNIVIDVNDDNVAISANDSGVANARMVITIPSSVMSTITSLNYVYDIQRTNTPTGQTPVVKTLLFGILRVNEDITA